MSPNLPELRKSELCDQLENSASTELVVKVTAWVMLTKFMRKPPQVAVGGRWEWIPG